MFQVQHLQFNLLVGNSNIVRTHLPATKLIFHYRPGVYLPVNPHYYHHLCSYCHHLILMQSFPSSPPLNDFQHDNLLVYHPHCIVLNWTQRLDPATDHKQRKWQPSDPYVPLSHMCHTVENYDCSTGQRRGKK